MPFLGLSTASATPLSLSTFSSLAARCAPAWPAETLQAVAQMESHLEPWALHNNTTGVSEVPQTMQNAIADASAWINDGDSVDLGLMQINSKNIPALGMTIKSAIDPCASLAGGAAVLKAAYGSDEATSNQQVGLLLALSRYNTGAPLKGIMNGYVHRVLENAKLDGSAVSTHLVNGSYLDPNIPPQWDISATGIYTQNHGALWLVPFALRVSAQSELPDLPLQATTEGAHATNNELTYSPP